MRTSKLLPTLFLSHGGGPAHLLDFQGSPFSGIDRSSPSAQFLRNLPQLLARESKSKQDIECILVVSAHWEEPQFTVEYPTSSKNTKLYYDYYGFPDEAYYPHMTYPVKTQFAVADQLIDHLEAASKGKWKIAKRERGYDHGVFIPLKVAFPEAKIPIVQLSLKEGLSMGEHIALGECLRPFRSQGVLIVASGQITHNLREIRSTNNLNGQDDPRAVEFCEFIRQLLESTTPENYAQQKQTLIHIADHAPHFYWAHPRPEHFVPLAVAFGAGFVAESQEPQESSTGDETGEDSKKINNEGEVSEEINAEDFKFSKRIYHEIVMSSMGIDSYIFR